jgi:hypothetical protein
MAGTGLMEEMNNSIRLAEAIHRLAGIFFPQEINANSRQLVQDLPDNRTSLPREALNAAYTQADSTHPARALHSHTPNYTRRIATLCYYVPHSGYAESPVEGVGHNCDGGQSTGG